MTEKDLDTRFQEAFEKASNMTELLPPDVMLRIYAYYKQATHGTIGFNYLSNNDLRNAFKTNAWMQISHLTPEEAKEEYIKMINEIIDKKK